MEDNPDTLDSPIQRLAASRAALLSQLMPRVTGKAADGARRTARNTAGYPSQYDSAAAAATATEAGQQNENDIIQFVKHALAGWWQHHPLHIAVDVARPYLDDYARRKPVKLLGIAAVVGVLAVTLKPWRLVSAAGLTALAIKSTNLSATLLSFFTRPSASRRASQDPEFLKGQK